MTNTTTSSIVVCNNDQDLANTLLHALRQAHGTVTRVFVREHDARGETLVALLPSDGPSLAAALRDWVYEWWSDEDTEKLGTPERYLQGFGVMIEPGDFTSFSTSCPYCGVDGALDVVSGNFQAWGISINADGFAFADAQMMQTDNEMVECYACHRTFSTDEIRL